MTSEWTTVRVSKQTKEDLDSVKHPGQNYDGVIQELIKLRQKSEKLEKGVKSDRRAK